MKEREPLKMNTELRFTNHAGGNMHFVVGSVVGLGGSCIVYSGYYRNNAGAKSTVRIKECYPYQLRLNRSEAGELIAADNETEKFEIYKERIRRAFKIANELHEAAGLTNYTINVFDVYEANNTVYIVSSYVEGNTLSNIEFKSLAEAVRVVISTAKSIERMHEQGYLYLDLKPQNILMYKEAPEWVQLFDFDSVIPAGTSENITEYRAAYSKGFAPIEQKNGNISQMGKYTDVYSIGALLFYLLFGRPPGAVDCGIEADYDYSKLKWDKLYQQKVYKELTVFFHNTLQAYYKDRYQDMSETIVQLTEIEKYAEMSVPFICSDYVKNDGLVIGREKECKELLNWYNRNEKLIFVTGMGGIGKSTIVRKFVSDNKDKFDYIIYLQFNESICETIADDAQFCISGYEKAAEESLQDYFVRKIRAARELTAGTNTLLVLDNYDGKISGEFTKLLNIDWRIIVITRSDMSSSGYAAQKIEELKESSDVYLLFENNMGRKLKNDELRKVDHIAEMVERHTLVLTLIAKQIARSYLDIGYALEIVKANGFSGMAPEKIDYFQDGIVYYGSVSTIIKSVYDISVLSEDKKKCLKFFSLFNITGIEMKEAKKVLQLESLDDVNELKDSGWIEIIDHNIQMHPLIRETIQQIEWTDEYRNIALDEMKILVREIRINGEYKEYFSKSTLDENILERAMNEDRSYVPDYKKLRLALSKARSVLRYCGEDKFLFDEKSYEDLMFATLMNSPKDQEDYIISNADIFFENLADKDPYRIIDLCDYVVYLLCQKEDYEKAIEYLDRAKQFAAKWKDNFVWGKYYEMLGDFYDAFLDGAYGGSDKDERALVNTMLHTADLSIKYMHRVRHETAKNLSAKYVLGKANLLIRSKPERSNRIKKLILSTKSTIEKYTLDYAEVRAIYHMAWAWYYTLCEKNENAVLDNLKEAARVEKQRNISDLDMIDYFFVPAANMMLEAGNIDKAAAWLEEAYDLCELHREELPYIRKKMDILCHEMDTYYIAKKYEDCETVMKRYDSVKQKASKYGMFLEML